MEFIGHNDLEAFLLAVSARDLVILGIEGFYLVKGGAMPEMNAIADFSSLLDGSDVSETSIKEARLFLRKVSKPDMFFDFAIDEQGSSRC